MMKNKKENKNGKMTLEKLAVMVARGFEGTDKKFEGIDKRLDRVEAKLSEHDRRFSKLEYQIDEVKEIVERFEKSDILNLQKRVQILERAVRVLSKQV